MKSISCLAIVSFLGLITLQQDQIQPLIPAPTQQSPNSSKSNQPPTTKAAQQTTDAIQEQDILDELEAILEIRKQLGGGVLEQLGDGFTTSMDPLTLQSPKPTPSQNAEEVFKEQLAKKLLQNPQPASRRMITAPTSPRIRRSLVQTAKPTVQERTIKIRRAARMLEEAAAMLEEANEFSHADSVRSSAKDLWQAAR